eukprot:TRINITY_DN8694_c0_g1_i1.p1 TRINITY_DN8694_c0_g1~~TRINITY_DN8694_c0_g1_i1.p1  ORF type:complete len:232 (-),score=38.96 TRINITY_DN8694_c0_g1_i1:333-1028(-)
MAAASTATPPEASPAEDEDDGLQHQVDTALERINVECRIVRSIRDCCFSVSIADPEMADTPLIAVSDGFCELTGYDRDSVVGRNCRFLNEGCDITMKDREGLRLSCKTGKHFNGMIPNRKADGSPFMNLLDMRGLAVGRYRSGRERWFVVAVQADLTEYNPETNSSCQMPLEHSCQMKRIADGIRSEMTAILQQTAIVATEGAMENPGEIEPYAEPTWLPGEVFEMPFLGG